MKQKRIVPVQRLQDMDARNEGTDLTPANFTERRGWGSKRKRIGRPITVLSSGELIYTPFSPTLVTAINHKTGYRVLF